MRLQVKGHPLLSRLSYSMQVGFLEHSRSASCNSYDSPVIILVPLVLGGACLNSISTICYRLETKQNWLYFLNNRMWSTSEMRVYLDMRVEQDGT